MDIIVDKDKVLKFLGYANKKPTDKIINILNEECEKVKNCIDISVHLKKLDIIFIDEKKVMLENNIELKGTHISKELYKCKYVYLVLYSIGNRIEDVINNYSNNNEMIRGLILDKIGVVVLDYVNEEVKKHISKKIDSLNISSEVYPEDKDFDIEHQRVIYDAFDDVKGISINDYFQYSPIKTVSLIIGIGKDKISKSRCEKCNNKCY